MQLISQRSVLSMANPRHVPSANATRVPYGRHTRISGDSRRPPYRQAGKRAGFGKEK